MRLRQLLLIKSEWLPPIIQSTIAMKGNPILDQSKVGKVFSQTRKPAQLIPAK